MEKIYQSRCVEENTKRIEELISLRQKSITFRYSCYKYCCNFSSEKSVGYPTHAAFVLEEKMAKNPETVEKFLSDLSAKLQVLWKKEKAKMLSLKAAEAEEFGFEFDGKIAKVVLSVNFSEIQQMLERAFDNFIVPLETFRKEQIGAVKERKKKFDKQTAKFCSSQERYLGLSTKKQGTILQEVSYLFK